MLDALARVLDLGSPERTHLFDLAGVALPPVAGDYPTEAPEELAQVVYGFEPNPAYLVGPRMDVLAWNAGAARLLHQPKPAPDGVPNMLWSLFTGDAPESRQRSETARRMLARFRAEHARRYDDPRFTQLIEALLEASDPFRELWRKHEVLDEQLGTKVVDDDELGELRMHRLQTIPTSHPELRMTQFVPADERTRVALSKLASSG